jgi:vacuolar-type H+-ATPase subunit E/Vma4
MPRIIGDVDELIAAIERAARSEISSRRGDGDRQVESILAQARERAERIGEEILAPARREAEQERRRRRAAAAREAEEEYLRAREDLLAEVWERGAARLEELVGDTDRYAEILRRLALEGARRLEAEQLTLASDERGHRLLTQQRLREWGEQLGAEQEREMSFERADEPLAGPAGLVVLETGGRRRVDLTFPTQLRHARQEIRERIFRRMVES